MSPRPDVSEERKSQILDAAEIVFSEKGIDQARMDDIAAKTGVSKGTVYLYYKSKEDLVTAILERIFQGAFNLINSRTTRQASATEAILQFTEEAIRDYKLMLRLMPVAYEFLAMAFHNKIVQKALTEYFHFYMQTLVPLIQRGIDSGEFRDVDAQEAAITIGAIYEGTLLLWVYDSSIVDLEKHIRASIQLLLDGLKTESKTS
jgi:AcrR family transcriptional regulator